MGRMGLAWVQRAAEGSHLQGAWWSQSSSSPPLFQSSVISVLGSAAADYVLNLPLGCGRRSGGDEPAGIPYWDRGPDRVPWRRGLHTCPASGLSWSWTNPQGSEAEKREGQGPRQKDCLNQSLGKTKRLLLRKALERAGSRLETTLWAPRWVHLFWARGLAGRWLEGCYGEGGSKDWDGPAGRRVTARLLCPQNSAGQNIGVGSHSLLQGIFLTWALNQVSCTGKWTLYYLNYQGSPGETQGL